MREPMEYEDSDALSDSDVETDLQSFDPVIADYGRSLGASLQDQKDPDILWVVYQAFHAPLPTSWTEYVDAEDRVYYYNSSTEVSTWNHPMDDVYRDLIQFIKKLRQAPKACGQTDDERYAQAMQDHLLEVHGRFVAYLGEWTGPFQSEDGGEYYFNERTQLSTWVNPLEECEEEIGIRQAVLSHCLLSGDVQKQPDAADGVTIPALQLPIGREREEPSSPFASARSFYTARDSSRSASSPHSCSVKSKGSESPPRIRSKGQPARALTELSPVSHPNQMREQGLDDTRTTATSRSSPKLDSTMLQKLDGAGTKAGEDHTTLNQSEDEMDLTFGCSAMPKVQIHGASPNGDRDGKTLAHDERVTSASLPPELSELSSTAQQ